MEMSEIEWLLIQEAARDLVAESEGKPVSVGEMQRDHPEGYKTAREFAEGVGNFIPVGMLSFKQAKRISEMIHSENEGLSSIQEILNMQPVNALTLTHLFRLERSRRARESANTRHDKQGGSRDKKEKLRLIWAGGEYDTRDKCAEKEHNALGVSFSTARGYLTNTPEPPSRC